MLPKLSPCRSGAPLLSIAITVCDSAAAAPCTAMVFVWSPLANGHPVFALSHLALNNTSMVFAFAPIAALHKRGPAASGSALAAIWPWAITSLLAAPTLLFAVQGEAILEQPLVIVTLAVATAISLFGFESGAASTTVVGLLIEAPAMLRLVRVVKQCERWHERGSSMRQVA